MERRNGWLLRGRVLPPLAAMLIAMLLANAAMLDGVSAQASVERVTQNTTTWAQDDTRGAGSVEWTEDDAYVGNGALRLTTSSDNGDKAGLYTHTMAGTPLADVSDISYATYKVSGPATAAASFQLQIASAACGSTTLVYEPYWNGTVSSGEWQTWDVSGGQFWSSKSVCGLTAGAGGPPLYTLAEVVALIPDAVVTGIGVNVGTYNPNYVVLVDAVAFNGTTYDFEVGKRPPSADACKKGGWQNFDDPAFKNQGACVSWVQTR